MTALAAFPHHPQQFMPAAAASPSSLFPSPPSSSSSAPHAAPAQPPSAAVDEDDLLALLGSDTFSLESARDRDLVLLQGFLRGAALPGAAAPSAPPPGAGGLSIGGQYQQGGAAGGWNGWRPNGGFPGDNSGAAGHYGSPMSFSSASNLPPAPSTSLNSNAPHYPSPAQSAFLNLAPAPSPPSYPSPRRGSLSSSRGRRSSGGGSSSLGLGGLAMGTRAPACSRERVPTLASFEGGGGAAGLEDSSAAAPSDGGWKSRLRSAKHAAEQPGQQHDEDVMME
ncbi:hypothetical protein JCM6882_006508 [Rhodosporidiobolus microsporus]